MYNELKDRCKVGWYRVWVEQLVKQIVEVLSGGSVRREEEKSDEMSNLQRIFCCGDAQSTGKAMSKSIINFEGEEEEEEAEEEQE